MPKGKKRTDMDLIEESRIRRKIERATERATRKMLRALDASKAKTPWEGMAKRYEGANPKR